MSLFEEYFPIERAGWTDEMLQEWEAHYAAKPFNDLVRELGTPFQRLPNGVLFRDRRRARGAT